MANAKAQRLPPGATLAHYRVDAAVGEGAMGTVYRAQDTSLDRKVGLKVLKPDVAKDEVFVERFVREARAAARVSHPNLTHIYFIGEQDDLHFFAMEFVEGVDLEAWVEQHGPMDVDQALEVLIQAARGLRAAHQASVVHRDVKPSNILLQEDGMARITDFGLAKSVGADVDFTQAGLVVGTPTYMSPEQCRGIPADTRTDIYALGLTAFYLLAGRKAYEATQLGELINDQMNTPLPSLQTVRPDVPDEVDAVLARMCAKTPDDRYSDMGAVVEALERCRPRPVPAAPLATRAFAAIGDLFLLAALAALFHHGLQRLLDVSEGLEHPVGSLAMSLVFATYHVLCEAAWGQTAGKWVFGIQARSRRGAREPLRALVPRFLIRYPWVLLAPLDLTSIHPVFYFSGEIVQGVAILGAFVAYLVTRGRTLSDILTKTCVTYHVPDVNEP